MNLLWKIIHPVLIILIFASELQCAVPRKKQKQKRKQTTTPKPFPFFNELTKGLQTLFNPAQWLPPQQQQVSTESPDVVENLVDGPLVFRVADSETGPSAEYSTGNAKIDRTITSFFGALTQIMDNMFQTFIPPTMNGTIWDNTPRPNGSGGLANFLSSFFCQIFMGLLSPNYNGKRCFVYRYPNTTIAPRNSPVRSSEATTIKTNSTTTKVNGLTTSTTPVDDYY